MKVIYDCASFLVLHIRGCASKRHPDWFEIVDKRRAREVCLSDEWAVTFLSQIQEWQVNAPTPAQVDAAPGRVRSVGSPSCTLSLGSSQNQEGPYPAQPIFADRRGPAFFHRTGVAARSSGRACQRCGQDPQRVRSYAVPLGANLCTG